MQYEQLTQDEMDDIVAANLHARETEHFHYALNHANYTKMLADPDFASTPPGWQDHVAKLLESEMAGALQVESVHKALKSHFDDPVRKAAAIERTTAVRADEKAARLGKMQAEAVAAKG